VFHSGKCELKLPISSFVAEKNDFCRKFAGITDFATRLKTTFIRPSSISLTDTFKDLISVSGKCELKFALENFQVDRNDFSRKFLGLQSNGKAFAKKYRQIASLSATAITSLTSAATIQASDTVADAQGVALT